MEKGECENLILPDLGPGGKVVQVQFYGWRRSTGSRGRIQWNGRRSGWAANAQAGLKLLTVAAAQAEAGSIFEQNLVFTVFA